MIEAIRNRLLDQYLEWRLKREKKEKDGFDFSRRLKEIRHVLVISSSDEVRASFIRQFIKRLYDIFSEVRVSTFDPGSLRKSDVNWLGLPRADFLQQMFSDPFDMVIDLHARQDKLVCYLVVKSAAPLRVNLVSGDYDAVFNLHIRSRESSSDADRMENILKYFQILLGSAPDNRQSQEKTQETK